MVRMRTVIPAFCMTMVLFLSGCSGDLPVGNIMGVPRRTQNEKQDVVFTDDSVLLEKLQQGEVSVDQGTLPEIRINLCAIGDIMAHNGTYEAAQVGDSYQFDYMFEDIAPYVEDADYLVGNLETVFAGRDRTYSSYPAFNTPEQMGESLAKVWGLDLLSTANNHSMDRGLSGLETTLDFLDSYGIAHTGTYRTEEESEELFLAEINGARIAFLSYTYGLNGAAPNDYSVNIISKDALRQDASAAREEGADFVVALLHWGNEYQRTASESQRELAQWLFANTEIDLIIGNHPHVTQPIEAFEVTFDGREKIGYVFYALGNFTSEQLFAYSNTGIIANIHLVIDREDYRKNRVEAITYTPVFVDPNPKATGKRYRVISVSQAVADYEAGMDPLISAKEYQQLSSYITEYEELLATLEIVREYRLS